MIPPVNETQNNFLAIAHLDIFAKLILKLRNLRILRVAIPLKGKCLERITLKSIKHLLLCCGVKNKRRKGQKMSVGGIR
jgi:hypothetical protein